MNKKWHPFNVVGTRTLSDKGGSCVKVSFGLARVNTPQLMSPSHLCLDFFSTCDSSKLVRRTSEDFPWSCGDWRCHLWTENNGRLSRRCSLKWRNLAANWRKWAADIFQHHHNGPLCRVEQRENGVKLWNDCVTSLLMLAFKCLSAWKTGGANRLRCYRPGKNPGWALTHFCGSMIALLSRLSHTELPQN